MKKFLTFGFVFVGGLVLGAGLAIKEFDNGHLIVRRDASGNLDVDYDNAR